MADDDEDNCVELSLKEELLQEMRANLNNNTKRKYTQNLVNTARCGWSCDTIMFDNESERDLVVDWLQTEGLKVTIEPDVIMPESGRLFHKLKVSWI